ncbi:dihydroorotate dehydrogenase [Coprinopsis marcescibilis]|uniref:Dihydroorotate dehydrogenase (quinone), mitochondrial n=1 Tax=Coprinopsis marcescibilis TaxID=230819 RepID=A0A5C3LBF6_COPMA|nr:dihydroorotate dehydrogenase [Coprinopsis marcescibilis]
MSLLHRGSTRLLSGRPVSSRLVASSRRTASGSASSSPLAPLRTALYAGVFAVSAGLFSIYYFDSRSAIHRYVLTPVLRKAFDAETSHKLAVKVLKYGLSPKDRGVDDPVLRGEIWGEEVSNPVGVAAGFDKDGEAVDGLFDLGFSWVEIGSVTPKPQGGNPKPRVFRLEEDQGMINRYGFPSQGHSYVLSRLQERLPHSEPYDATSERASLRPGDFLAVNLGKNKESPADSIEDFVKGVKTFGPYSDVLVINVSSPNTPGLRGLQNRDQLQHLLQGVTAARDNLALSPLTANPPKLLLKIAPDLDEDQLADIADVILKSKIDGVIVSNTTIQRPKHLMNANREEIGGLSGAPVKPYSLKALKTLRQHLPSSIPLIGCGGIATGKDALDFAKAGASLVQLYTSFGYDGVGAPRRIKDELVEELKKEGKTWIQVVNESIDKLSPKLSPLNDEIQKGEGAVTQLVHEAEHLKEMLGQLGDRIEKEAHDRSVESGEVQASSISA